MTVKFFAYLRDRDYAGCKEIQMECPGTVLELGKKLTEKYGKKFKNEFFAPGETELGERIIVMVNGRRVEFLEGIRTELKESDTVQIFPVVAGG